MKLKNKIINSASKLFMKNGYEKTSVQDILDDCKVSKGGLYHHFASKEEIMLAIVDKVIDDISESVIKVFKNKTLTPTQKFLIWIKQKMDITSVNKRIIIRIFESDKHVLIREKYLNKLRKKIYPLLIENARGGVEAGEFKMKYPEEMMGLILAMREGIKIPLSNNSQKDIQKILIATAHTTELIMGLKENTIIDFLKE